MEYVVLSRGLSILLGAILSIAIAIGARAAGALTRDGALAAVVIGTVVFGFGGVGPAVLLVTFFLTSSLLTRWQADRKSHPEHRRGRTGAQVAANGGLVALLSVWHAYAPSPELAAAMAGAIATVTADTWGTEIGLLSPERPRLITTRRPVPPGTSGAVTWWGTIAGIAGAALIAAGASWLLRLPPGVIWLAGILGMTADSILGAMVEGAVEWMNNDAVNTLATVAGAVLAVVILVFR